MFQTCRHWAFIAILSFSALAVAQTNTQTKTETNTQTGAAKTPGKALFTLDVAKGWVDATMAGNGKTAWKALLQKGVGIDFPALAKGEWINFFLPLREGSWPKEGVKVVFRARADKPVKMTLRLNEMPGAAEGQRARHDEWEAHVIAFEAGPAWRGVELDLRDARKLWGHDGGNGKLDLDRITGLGFEPADATQAVHFEVSAITVLPGPPRESAIHNPQSAIHHASGKHRIVFNSDRNGDYEIYAMDDDGANLDRLTHHPGYDLWPAPSPDGKRIAWMTNRDGDYEIYVMNADGSDPVNISKSPKSQEGHPTWSPDGKQIAFTSDRDGDMELYIMDAAGGNWRRLTHAKGSDGLPSFSPDGKQIVFVSERDNDHELYRINADGTGLARLTNRKGLDTMPAWSPDGKTIAFVSDRDGVQAIFLMDPGGSNVRRLAGPKAFAAWPDWSPDGKSICFHALIGDHFSICAVNVGGVHAHVDVLTRGRGANRNPRFAVLAEDAFAPPAIPAGGVRIAATVKGFLRSGAGGPNPQKYPFNYRGYAVLDKTQIESLSKVRDGDVPPAIARALGQALLWPGAGDSLESMQLSVAAGKLKGTAKVLHRYGKQGTHTIAVNLQGTILDGKLSLQSIKPFIDGTWDWGGGIAKQEGEVEIAFEVQAAGDFPHAPIHPAPPPKAPAEADAPIAGALKLTAVVEGFTQATQFNMQKYPFKYTGVSALTADQLRDLAKAGDVPDATARALLGCLLWPRADDSLQNLALKSDGKKLTGKAEVLHKYGQQGTHVLKLRVEGTIAGGQLTLQILEPTVSGSWNWGGGAMQLAGKVQIAIQSAK